MDYAIIVNVKGRYVYERNQTAYKAHKKNYGGRKHAGITAVDRKKVSFHIIARDAKDTIGTAQHDRFIVKKESFEARALSKLEK